MKNRFFQWIIVFLSERFDFSILTHFLCTKLIEFIENDHSTARSIRFLCNRWRTPHIAAPVNCLLGVLINPLYLHRQHLPKRKMNGFYRLWRPSHKQPNHVVYYVARRKNVSKKNTAVSPSILIRSLEIFGTTYIAHSLEFDYGSKRKWLVAVKSVTSRVYLPVQWANMSFVNCKSLQNTFTYASHVNRQGHRKSISLEMHKWVFFIAKVFFFGTSPLSSFKRLPKIIVSVAGLASDALTSISRSVNHIDPCRRNGIQ